MYVILVYDVEQERVAKVCQFLRRYMNWVQNSAFEGELSEAQVERVKTGLKDIIDEDRDSIYIYILRDAKWVKREVIGQIKGETGNII